MKKLTLLAAAAAGYVLGSRAGRERYDQIKAQATKAWNNPTVQSAVDDVQAQAKQAGADAGSKVGHKVAGAASDAKAKVADRLSGADADPASDTYRPDDEVVGPPPAPGGSRIADAAREGTS
ncbi:hypothetical protein C6I20_15400 [Aeromicrobium sp. A1-2]|uniref:YtxH domain-containing protein n=1 Tax=Aeromicrobium sp. A1-2 TaxID=2107713 RepID=UPI000E49DDF9|nr:YtxH domain-containing protein [Aeromicrobium sp. A1-2]AXT86423.1 hypothetical protein C6I20_15400 [Aeromicrobium sp. A1-2]